MTIYIKRRVDGTTPILLHLGSRSLGGGLVQHSSFHSLAILSFDTFYFGEILASSWKHIKEHDLRFRKSREWLFITRKVANLNPCQGYHITLNLADNRLGRSHYILRLTIPPMCWNHVRQEKNAT